MTQNSPKPIQQTPPSSEEDYSIIEQALLQNPRGKWFLEEYIKRNRPEDTKKLLNAIERIENTLDERNPKPETDIDPIRMSIIEMANAIAKTREEIKSIKPANETDNQLSSATEELGAIVTSTEDATNTILEAAEEIQESAWLLREAGAEEGPCDRIDNKTTEIYTACSFQDITGQRTNKVVQALAYIENRVNAMIEIWGLGDFEQEIPGRKEQNDARPDAHLLNGPAKLGEELHQTSVDEMLTSHEAEYSAENEASELQEETDNLDGQDFADSISFDQINPADETGLDGDIDFEPFSEAIIEDDGHSTSDQQLDTADLTTDDEVTLEEPPVHDPAIDLDNLMAENSEAAEPTLGAALENDLIDTASPVENSAHQNTIEVDLESWPEREGAADNNLSEISAINPGLEEIETPPSPEHQETTTNKDKIDLDLDDLIVTEMPEQEQVQHQEEETEPQAPNPNKEEKFDMNCLSFDDLENLEELDLETLSDDQKDTLLG